MNKYKIEFTKKQLSTVATALEFYSRFLTGQWEIPDAMEMQEYVNQGQDDIFWTIRNSVKDMLDTAKEAFTGDTCNYAIGSPDLHEDAKISYDIYRPILETFAKEQDYEDSYFVYNFEELTYSQEGRIKVEKINYENT